MSPAPIPTDAPRWVAPPGWPTPPVGWYPTPGWVPPATWPAPPPGWAWWQDGYGRPVPTPRVGPHPHPAARHAVPAPTVRSWRDAEVATASLMRQVGYRDATVTRGGADGGIDVIGSRVVAQVKWHASQVGRPDLQKLVGAAGTGRQLVFVSRSGFSRPAVEYAARVSMALITLDQWAVARPVNPVARQLLTARAR